MIRHAVAIIVLLALSFPIAAQSGWWDTDGNPLPETEAWKSSSGFSASLVVTPDKDWEAKWKTPPANIPHFTEGREVKDGGELFVLTFLSNPQVDDSGAADVVCDIVVTRPDGSKSVDASNLPCLKGKLRGNPAHVYLAGPVIKHVAEPADPRGVWSVSVTVKDRLRSVTLLLNSSFNLR